MRRSATTACSGWPLKNAETVTVFSSRTPSSNGFVFLFLGLAATAGARECRPVFSGNAD